MFVRDILAAKGSEVITVGPDTAIRDLAELLVDHGIGAAVVTDDAGGVVGVISERDVIHGIASCGGDCLDMSIGDLMTRDVVSCHPDTTIDRVMARMTDRRIRHLPVMADDGMAGIISIGNVVKHRIAEAERETNRLREHNVEMESLVAERTRELRNANLKLRQASRNKSEFLANMSHELRTPLNAIIGFTRLVMRRSKADLAKKQYENLDKIQISANHLLALINDILDLSKIEAGRVEADPTAFTLAPMVEQCMRTVEPMATSNELRLVHDLSDDLPELFTDQGKLRQILMNLLSNAVKFTKRGRVAVVARRQDQSVALSVTDTGIGISADAQKVIFDAFGQADTKTAREYGGTGLGLSISRQLAQLMGGDITVQSTPGEGSTFTVSIPFHMATRPARVA
jgi:signal transduction histidine kinase